MSDKRAEAVLKVVPSAKAIEWLKDQIGKEWRETATGWLGVYLETLVEAGQDADVFRLVESIAPGLAETPAEVLHLTALDEIGERVKALRVAGKQLRLDVLDAERESLRRELEGTRLKETPSPGASPKENEGEA